MSATIRTSFALAFGLGSGLAFGVLFLMIGDEIIREHRAEQSA